MESIDSLQLQDDQPLSGDESEVLEKYFAKKKAAVAKACTDSKFKIALYMGVIFVLINNPFSETLFEMVASPNLRYLAKLVVFMVLAYVVILATK